MQAITVIYYLVIFLWLSYLPVAIIFLKGWLRNRKVYINKNLVRVHNDPSIIFQIMTRSARASDVVKRGIESIHSSCKEIDYSSYSICVVTEDPEDVSYVSGARVLVVPQGYSTEKGAIRKARAMQYAVEVRRSEGDDKKNKWLFHMDEESVVTSQTVLSLLAFIREGKGLISEGPIAYPMKAAQSNRLTFLTESIRPFQCFDCVSHMTHPPPMYMHGSNLLVRSDVEDKVGWDNGTSLAEDQLFGVKVHESYGNVFGWHGGVLLEQPPLTLMDHFKQRKRWVFGTLQNLKYLPTKLKLRIYLRSATYWLGFLSAMASIGMYLYYFSPYVIKFFAGLFGVKSPVPNTSSLPILTVQKAAQLFGGGPFVLTWQNVVGTALGASLMLAFIIWVASYQLGLGWNLRFGKYSSRKRVSLHLQQLVLGPLIGMIETYPSFYAIFQYHLSRQKVADFDVIAK